MAMVFLKKLLSLVHTNKPEKNWFLVRRKLVFKFSSDITNCMILVSFSIPYVNASELTAYRN